MDGESREAQAARIAALKEQLRQERELDQQLAALLGWHSFTPGLHGGMLLGLKAEEPAAAGVTSRHEEVPWYSTDMGAAWPLAERFGLIVGPTYQAHPQAPKWRACKGWQEPQELDVEGMTAPEAICRAVLQALREE